VAQVLDKEAEQEVECTDKYVYLNFIKNESYQGTFQWPSQEDRLNIV
jgi:hypothetical protein